MFAGGYSTVVVVVVLVGGGGEGWRRVVGGEEVVVDEAEETRWRRRRRRWDSVTRRGLVRSGQGRLDQREGLGLGGRLRPAVDVRCTGRAGCRQVMASGVSYTVCMHCISHEQSYTSILVVGIGIVECVSPTKNK